MYIVCGREACSVHHEVLHHGISFDLDPTSTRTPVLTEDSRSANIFRLYPRSDDEQKHKAQTKRTKKERIQTASFNDEL